MPHWCRPEVRIPCQPIVEYFLKRPSKSVKNFELLHLLYDSSTKYLNEKRTSLLDTAVLETLATPCIGGIILNLCVISFRRVLLRRISSLILG